MRAQLFIVIFFVLGLQGCVPRQANYGLPIFQPTVSDTTITLQLATEICREIFPEAINPRDDGGNHFSIQGSVNVILDDVSGAVVCSVDSNNGLIDRINANNKVFSLSEFKSFRKRWDDRPANAEFLAAKAEAAKLENGDYSEFLKTAKRKILTDFKDPDSAKFRDLYISDKNLPTLCGEVNGKNSYGGYVGYRGFFYNRLMMYIDDEKPHGNGHMYRSLVKQHCGSKFRSVE